MYAWAEKPPIKQEDTISTIVYSIPIEKEKKKKKQPQKVHIKEAKQIKKKKKDDSSDSDSDDDMLQYVISDLEEFSQLTTLHGLHFITGKDSSIARRVTWTLIVVGMMAWLVYSGIVVSVIKYFDRPINTVMSLNYVDDLKFPAITLCNYNQFRLSELDESTSTVIKLMSKSTYILDPEGVNWNTVIAALRNYDSINMTSSATRLAHQIETMLLFCSWQGVQPCDPRNFSTIITDFGVCYSFNNVADDAALRARQTGSDFGLMLRLHVQQYEYSFGENSGAGFKLLIHPQGHLPLVNSFGISLSPGFETHIAMRKTRVFNLQEPYESNCTNEKLEHSPYTVPICDYLCKVDYIIQHCGCRDYKMPGNVRVCSPLETVQCIFPVSDDFVNKHIRCSCPTACFSETYEPAISSTFWPSEFLSNAYLPTLNLTTDYARRNFLEIRIFFEEMSFSEIRQVPAYEKSSLMSDIGGFMGLLCGMSLTTIFEFFDLLFCNFIVGWKKRPVAP
ncbi:acid-sensing ion channel 1C-like [Antedon mediterranea]|uniref:acid-sensing ion channel 1C-like n=1 Tax=Antedon mediterranea TaxID=105859 RepID=UPI003AF6C62F